MTRVVNPIPLMRIVTICFFYFSLFIFTEAFIVGHSNLTGRFQSVHLVHPHSTSLHINENLSAGVGVTRLHDHPPDRSVNQVKGGDPSRGKQQVVGGKKVGTHKIKEENSVMKSNEMRFTIRGLLITSTLTARSSPINPLWSI